MQTGYKVKALDLCQYGIKLRLSALIKPKTEVLDVPTHIMNPILAVMSIPVSVYWNPCMWTHTWPCWLCLHCQFYCEVYNYQCFCTSVWVAPSQSATVFELISTIFGSIAVTVTHRYWYPCCQFLLLKYWDVFLILHSVACEWNLERHKEVAANSFIEVIHIDSKRAHRSRNSVLASHSYLTHFWGQLKATDEY